MPKYLIQASYTAEGSKGLLKDGGSKRREAAAAALKSAGATLESFYYAFGDSDVYAVIDAPDHASMIGASIAINASGAVAIKTTVLMTPEEIDQAVKKTVAYTPPGR
jgi:uncharacterized protein with GYD domain